MEAPDSEACLRSRPGPCRRHSQLQLLLYPPSQYVEQDGARPAHRQKSTALSLTALRRQEVQAAAGMSCSSKKFMRIQVTCPNLSTATVGTVHNPFIIHCSEDRYPMRGTLGAQRGVTHVRPPGACPNRRVCRVRGNPTNQPEWVVHKKPSLPHQHCITTAPTGILHCRAAAKWQLSDFVVLSRAQRSSECLPAGAHGSVSGEGNPMGDEDRGAAPTVLPTPRSLPRAGLSRGPSVPKTGVSHPAKHVACSYPCTGRVRSTHFTSLHTRT